MPEVHRLWDALLSDMRRPHPLLHYVCVALIIRIRRELLAGDFTKCLQMLQRHPGRDVSEDTLPVEEVLLLATRLRSGDLAGPRSSHADQEEHRPGVLQNLRSRLQRSRSGMLEGSFNG